MSYLILTEYGIGPGYKCDICGNFYAPIHLFWNIRPREVTEEFSHELWAKTRRPNGAGVVCQFCTVRCDECGKFQSLDEGHHSVDLDDRGFLTGEEIHLCAICKEKNDATTAEASPCLSNTPKTPADGTK